jgi:hypothetical protein
MQYNTLTLFDDILYLCNLHLITTFNYYVRSYLFESIFYLLKYLSISFQLR